MTIPPWERRPPAVEPPISLSIPPLPKIKSHSEIFYNSTYLSHSLLAFGTESKGLDTKKNSELFGNLMFALFGLILVRGHKWSWWRYERPLILNELAVFYSTTPLRVTTIENHRRPLKSTQSEIKVTTPTLIY